MSTTQLGYDVERDQEAFMPQRRYRIRYRCDKCGHEWSRTYKCIPAKDPACPNKSCAEQSEIEELRRQVANLTRMLESGTPPAQIGRNVKTKAVDATADIVMSDYKLTDLKDSIRPGESMAPKLPPAQQAAADNYFGGGAMKAAGISAKQASLLGRRAIAGAYRNMAVPPSTIMPQQVRSGNSPLTLLRTEQVRK